MTTGNGAATMGKEIDPELLRRLLRYDPETGKLFWLERDLSLFTSIGRGRAWNAQYAGREALTSPDGAGYLQGNIFERRYRAHRVAWAVFHGVWPTNQIDHINGNRADNKIVNLRDVPPLLNLRNSKRPTHNRSGVSGVAWDATRGKWHAYIGVGGKTVSLGRFIEFSSAKAARLAAERDHDFHPNHGRMA